VAFLFKVQVDLELLVRKVIHSFQKLGTTSPVCIYAIGHHQSNILSNLSFTIVLTSHLMSGKLEIDVMLSDNILMKFYRTFYAYWLNCVYPSEHDSYFMVD
jgi:hypothetical protein